MRLEVEAMIPDQIKLGEQATEHVPIWGEVSPARPAAHRLAHQSYAVLTSLASYPVPTSPASYAVQTSLSLSLSLLSLSLS